MLTTLSKHPCVGGTVGYYRHLSSSNNCEMNFAVYSPPQAEQQKVPILYFLAGLTCTHETFMIKAGAQRFAAQHGIMLVAPDTSPRGESIADDNDWDLGQGAGFYLNASEEPWRAHFQMYSYITEELPNIIEDNFSANTSRQGIFGHSMGGHGAITIALKNKSQFQSVSAFAPICAPTQCPWGHKAFSAYLGNNKAAWGEYDATEIMKNIRDISGYPEILIDQGMQDQFLEQQLHPHLLQQAAKTHGYPLSIEKHPHYDHSYFFISSFIEKHLQHHANALAPN